MKGGNNMKRFEEPIVELEVLGIEDVITTSTCPEFNEDCPWEG